MTNYDDAYTEACEKTISRKCAEFTLKAHGFTLEEFVKDAGDKQTYKGKEVLDWLGY